MSEQLPDIDQRIDAFASALQAKIEEHTRRNFPNLTPSQVGIEPGKRYVRIVTITDGGRGQRSAWGFIDTTTGDLLRAESWKKPAKHPRGNLYDEHGGLRFAGVYGPAYMDEMKGVA